MPRLRRLGSQRDLKGARDRLGDLVLNGEDVGELAVVALRPEVIAVLGVNELRGDADRLPAGGRCLRGSSGHRALRRSGVMSCSLPRNANADVRAVTFRPGTWASTLMISSARPSLKYSSSGSRLMLANGSTAIDGCWSAGLATRLFAVPRLTSPIV